MKIKMKKEIIKKVLEDLKKGIYTIILPHDLSDQITVQYTRGRIVNADTEDPGDCVFDIPDTVIVGYMDIFDLNNQKIKALMYMEYFRCLLGDEEITVSTEDLFDDISIYDDINFSLLFKIMSDKILNNEKEFRMSHTITPITFIEEVYIENNNTADNAFTTTFDKLIECAYEYLCENIRYNDMHSKDADPLNNRLFENILNLYMVKHGLDVCTDKIYTSYGNMRTYLTMMMMSILQDKGIETLPEIEEF